MSPALHTCGYQYTFAADPGCQHQILNMQIGGWRKSPRAASNVGHSGLEELLAICYVLAQIPDFFLKFGILEEDGHQAKGRSQEV